jgi:hypothetical protein
MEALCVSMIENLGFIDYAVRLNLDSRLLRNRASAEQLKEKLRQDLIRKDNIKRPGSVPCAARSTDTFSMNPPTLGTLRRNWHPSCHLILISPSRTGLHRRSSSSLSWTVVLGLLTQASLNFQFRRRDGQMYRLIVVVLYCSSLTRRC